MERIDRILGLANFYSNARMLCLLLNIAAKALPALLVFIYKTKSMCGMSVKRRISRAGR
jgi:hypothetical protein